jgi:hypothetical protein
MGMRRKIRRPADRPTLNCLTASDKTSRWVGERETPDYLPLEDSLTEPREDGLVRGGTCATIANRRSGTGLCFLPAVQVGKREFQLNRD